jgi:hypothetical protein
MLRVGSVLDILPGLLQLQTAGGQVEYLYGMRGMSSDVLGAFGFADACFFFLQHGAVLDMLPWVLSLLGGAVELRTWAICCSGMQGMSSAQVRSCCICFLDCWAAGTVGCSGEWAMLFMGCQI